MESSLEDRQWARITSAIGAVLFRGALDKRTFREDDVKRDHGKFAEQSGGAAKTKEPKAKKIPVEKKAKTKKAAPKFDSALLEQLRMALKDSPDLMNKVEALLGAAGASSGKSSPSAGNRTIGEPHKIVTPDGKIEIEVQPEVVELADLIHAKGDLQPRNRNTAESKTAIRERAAKLDPEQLKPGRVSDAGAPIVSKDGTVISGNGRTMSLREVYNDPAFKAKAEAYRQSLGDAAKGMKQPVLIQRMPDMDHKQLAEFADRSNRSRIEGMSATERAQRDAKAAGPDIVGLYRGGDFTSAENRPFMHAFTQKAMAANERAQFSKEGRLTKEGHDRLSAAVLASAYEDVDALSLMLESTDDNVKSITNAMKDTAGRFAELKAGIKTGRILPEMDVTAQIADAAKLVSSLRKRGVSPASHFAQADAFSRPDPMVEAIVKSFYNDTLSKAISQQKITSILGAYAEEAMKHEPGGFLPDETKAPDVLAAASRKVKAESASEPQDLFAGNAGHEPRNGEGRSGNGRQAARAAGGRTQSGKLKKAA